MTTLNNRTLTIILIALVVVYIGARIVRVPKREGALAIALVHIDTAAVTKIKLYPNSEGGEEVAFTRSALGWQVARNGLAVEADSNAVKGLMVSFIGLSANRVVAERRSSWDEYRVGDTTGSRIVVLGGDDELLGEWWVGEAPAQGGMYGGGQSYVRLASGDNVYAVDGYLHAQYNKAFNDWRNKAFLRVDKNSINGVTATGIHSWKLQRDSTLWLLDGVKADSAAAERYIGRFASMNLADFADDVTADSAADLLLTIHGVAGDLASVQAWKKSDNTWVVQSSQRPRVFFSVDKVKFDEEIAPESLLFVEK